MSSLLPLLHKCLSSSPSWFLKCLSLSLLTHYSCHFSPSLSFKPNRSCLVSIAVLFGPQPLVSSSEPLQLCLIIHCFAVASSSHPWPFHSLGRANHKASVCQAQSCLQRWQRSLHLPVSACRSKNFSSSWICVMRQYEQNKKRYDIMAGNFWSMVHIVKTVWHVWNICKICEIVKLPVIYYWFCYITDK